MEHAHIHVTGIVQGVGMRPFVYREAMAHRIHGWVLNAGDGVHIEAHAAADDLAAFVRDLSAHAPAASRVEHVEAVALAAGAWNPADEKHFTIVASEDETAHTTLISPDIATCDDCLRELFDPTDRRFHYPFINCTNCGPRFTIIRSLPYDRAATSMSAFPMCPDCAREYTDPLDRRFHAQPDACFECGPHITWRERGDEETLVGHDLGTSDGIIERCIELIASGGIVAIKGLGGFHLACNACDETAVTELRRRKRRSNKPLAVMVRGLDAVRSLCLVDDTERDLLAGSIRPIVLLQRRPGTSPLAPSVAFDLPELGTMLPYTPLQHLLLAAANARGISALVMTSGNISEEPIETDDAHAWEQLVASGIADALLGNDRAILSRYDDSVVRVVDGRVMPVRRARGYAPQPLELPRIEGAAPCILACGPEQKATVALTRERRDGTASCFISQHIGDVENGATFDAWHDARTRLSGLFDLEPAAIACDLHPSYLSSQWGREQARSNGLPLVEVQHHHAHIASVLAEASSAGLIDTNAKVIGIAFDGTGAGEDGTVWGGEFLIAGLASYERAAHLRTWALPGGAASVRDARRNAFSLLSELGLLDHPGARPLLDSLDEQTRAVTATMIDRGINSPRTSSMGRFFDAAAALLGICGRATYEGEPAIELESAAWKAFCVQNDLSVDKKRRNVPSEQQDEPNPGDFSPLKPQKTPQNARIKPISPENSPEELSRWYISSVFVQKDGIVDTKCIIERLLNGIQHGIDPASLALHFHRDVADMTAAVAAEIRDAAGIETIALSGGVFMNRLLLQLVRDRLTDLGFTVLVPHTVPVNDGCIAYGQAAVARARLAAVSQA